MQNKFTFNNIVVEPNYEKDFGWDRKYKDTDCIYIEDISADGGYISVK